MRVRHFLAFGISFVLAAVVVAQGSGKAAKPVTKSNNPIFKPAADLKWTDLDPTGAPGVKIADVWGDHTKGGFGAFVKFPAGFTTPLHTHTNALKLVVISGTFVQIPEGKSEVRLGPGSYIWQPGGDYRHTSGCDKASDCLFFSESTGKFDLIPAEAKK